MLGVESLSPLEVAFVATMYTTAIALLFAMMAGIADALEGKAQKEVSQKDEEIDDA